MQKFSGVEFNPTLNEKKAVKAKKNYAWLIVVFVIVIDQISKLAVAKNMFEYESINIFGNGLLFLTYIKNSGIAFGIMPQYNSIYAISSLIIACVMMIFMWCQKGKLSKPLAFGLYLLIAGAIGNVIDRLMHEYVIDFIELGFINFAIFNIADIAITLGALIAIFALMFEKEKQ